MVLSSSAGAARANVVTYGKSKNIRFGGPRKVVGTLSLSSDSDDESSSSSSSDEGDTTAINPARKKTQYSSNTASCRSVPGPARPYTAPEHSSAAIPIKTALTPQARLTAVAAAAAAAPPSSSPLSSPPPLSSSPLTLCTARASKQKVRRGQASDTTTARSRHPNRKAGVAAQARVQSLLINEAQELAKTNTHSSHTTIRKACKPTVGRVGGPAAIRSTYDSSNSVELLATKVQEISLETPKGGPDQALRALLDACKQNRQNDFAEAIDGLLSNSNDSIDSQRVAKAGEASYSEVFRICGSCTTPSSILKVIPVENPTRRASALTLDADATATRQSHCRKASRSTHDSSSSSSTERGKGEEVIASLPLDVKREIDITRRLAALTDSSKSTSGRFVQLHSAQVVSGAYPPVLLAAWDQYDLERGGSENARPKARIGDDELEGGQLYCLLHLSDGGEDVESVVLSSWTQALAIFAQTVHLLARAEQRAEFEHRDLHWGNILVEKLLCFDDQGLDGEGSAVERCGPSPVGWSDLINVYTSKLRTTIIDYTLSKARLSCGALASSADFYANKSLFTGDADQDYQFEVYRLMRTHVRQSCVQAQGQTQPQCTDKGGSKGKGRRSDEVQSFFPGTNIIWCHYLVRKLLWEKNLKEPAVVPIEERIPTVTVKRTSSLRGRAAKAQGISGNNLEAERGAYQRLVEVESVLSRTVESLQRGGDGSDAIPATSAAAGIGNARKTVISRLRARIMLNSSVQLQEYLEANWK